LGVGDEVGGLKYADGDPLLVSADVMEEGLGARARGEEMGDMTRIGLGKVGVDGR